MLMSRGCHSVLLCSTPSTSDQTQCSHQECEILFAGLLLVLFCFQSLLCACLMTEGRAYVQKGRY